MSVTSRVVSVSDLVVVGPSGCSVVGAAVTAVGVVSAKVRGADVVGKAVVGITAQEPKAHVCHVKKPTDKHSTIQPRSLPSFFEVNSSSLVFIQLLILG